MSSKVGSLGNPAVSFTQIASVTEEARVRDYDELSSSAMDVLPELLDLPATRVDRSVLGDLENGEIVRFTDYYRVDVLD